MNKKILKMLSLMSLVLLFSVNTAFAYDAAKVNQPDNNIMAAMTFEAHGGHGEWGYGLIHMWGKYWHSTKDHRVVLIRDNSYIYGAWEGPGATESYREDVKGNNMNCSGETR